MIHMLLSSPYFLFSSPLLTSYSPLLSLLLILLSSPYFLFSSPLLYVCRVCFERVPYQPTLVTFFLSAVWHGFYLKYYVVAVMATLLIEAGRKVSRVL